jgi:hypothetical protein
MGDRAAGLRPRAGDAAGVGPGLREGAGVDHPDGPVVAELGADVVAELGHDRLVVPHAGADDEQDGLAVHPRRDGDRLAGLAPQAAEQAAEDEGGGRPPLGAAESGQVSPEEGGQPALAAADGLGVSTASASRALASG